MNQVQINPTKLSILSISRPKYWLFKSAILEFLHQQAETTPNGGKLDMASDDDMVNDMANDMARVTVLVNKRESISSISSFDKEIDNSNKETQTSSSSPNYSSQESHESYFFHIAFSPMECTMICSESVVNRLFKEPLHICEVLGYKDVKLINETFVSLQIDSGSNDRHRILELTKPLSENNISLFFISSHFSDIVLIPHTLEDKVVNILQNNNFAFSDISGSYIIKTALLPIQRIESNELENHTFSLFKTANIKPIVNKNVSLLLTGSRSNDVNRTISQTSANISKNKIPDYFAITRTSINEVSLILPKSSQERSQLGFHSKHLIGSTQDIVNPITIDLLKLAIDSTGIVAGVASRIINSVDIACLELNYLSMARSAILLIPKEDIDVVETVLNDIDYNVL